MSNAGINVMSLFNDGPDGVPEGNLSGMGLEYNNDQKKQKEEKSSMDDPILKEIQRVMSETEYYPDPKEIKRVMVEIKSYPVGKSFDAFCSQCNKITEHERTINGIKCNMCQQELLT